VSGGRQSFAIPAFYFAILSGKKLSCLLNEMAEFDSTFLLKNATVSGWEFPAEKIDYFLVR
jgi:hypothetical protein